MLRESPYRASIYAGSFDHGATLQCKVSESFAK